MYKRQGNILNDLGRKKEALDSYNKALGIRPDYDKMCIRDRVFLKGDAYKVESLAKILLKEGWAKGASLQPEEAAVFLHAPGERCV